MSLEKIFEHCDKNNDGMLSLGEFSDALLAYSPNFSPEDIQRWFKEIDVNGNGQIDTSEFVSWFEKMLERSFAVCDVDGNRKITAKKLHSVMTAIGKTYTEEECAEKVRVADTDNDGCLNYEEFKAMLIKGI